MNLEEAIESCFQSRPSWATGKGRITQRINANHVLRILGKDVEVSEINTQHFKQITQQLQQEGKKPATINRITGVLSVVLNELRSEGIDAPRVQYKRQREPNARPGYYLEEEVNAILKAATQERDGLLLHDSILFAIKTGCRQGEMLKLTVDDVDIDSQSILFQDTKAGRDHWLKMHDDIVPVIERRSNLTVDGTLFPWSNKEQLIRAFKRCKLEAGIDPNDKRVWHTLRASVATWLCERNVPLRTVMGVLNHSRVETTLRYAKASDRSVAAAVDLL
jgi:integrase